VFPCDFYAQPQWKLGNINDTDFTTLVHSEKRAAFDERKGRISAECRECRWRPLCAGDCTRYRSVTSGPQVSRLCPGFKEFLDYSETRFVEISQDIIRRRAMLQKTRNIRSPSSRQQRNAPCACGSGKKFKHCCGDLTTKNS
jgi:uncharacterized protein